MINKFIGNVKHIGRKRNSFESKCWDSGRKSQPSWSIQGSFSSEWYRERYRLAIIYKEEEKKQHKANDCFNV